MFIAVVKVTVLVIAAASFGYIEDRKEAKKFEGLKRLYDENGKPLNEWIPLDYAG